MHWAIWHSPLVLGLSVTRNPCNMVDKFLYREFSLSLGKHLLNPRCSVPSGLICREMVFRNGPVYRHIRLETMHGYLNFIPCLRSCSVYCSKAGDPSLYPQSSTVSVNDKCMEVKFLPFFKLIAKLSGIHCRSIASRSITRTFHPVVLLETIQPLPHDPGQ